MTGVNRYASPLQYSKINLMLLYRHARCKIILKCSYYFGACFYYIYLFTLKLHVHIGNENIGFEKDEPTTKPRKKKTPRDDTVIEIDRYNDSAFLNDLYSPCQGILFSIRLSDLYVKVVFNRKDI